MRKTEQKNFHYVEKFPPGLNFIGIFPFFLVRKENLLLKKKQVLYITLITFGKFHRKYEKNLTKVGQLISRGWKLSINLSFAGCLFADKYYTFFLLFGTKL